MEKRSSPKELASRELAKRELARRYLKDFIDYTFEDPRVLILIGIMKKLLRNFKKLKMEK